MCRIKADWDTLQIFMKSRVSNPFCQWRASTERCIFGYRRITKVWVPSNPVFIGVSSHPFDVASYRSDGSRMAYKPRAIAFFFEYNYIENNAKPYSTDH